MANNDTQRGRDEESTDGQGRSSTAAMRYRYEIARLAEIHSFFPDPVGDTSRTFRVDERARIVAAVTDADVEDLDEATQPDLNARLAAVCAFPDPERPFLDADELEQVRENLVETFDGHRWQCPECRRTTTGDFARTVRYPDGSERAVCYPCVAEIEIDAALAIVRGEARILEADETEVDQDELTADGGRQTAFGDPDDDIFGIRDLSAGDKLKVTYDSPRSDYEQKRLGEVAAIQTVEGEHAPTGSTEVVLSRRDEDDLILWPAWGTIRTDAAGNLGDIVEVERLDQHDNQARLAPDGGSVDLGEIHAASVLDDGGSAVLAIKGTDGAASVAVPPDMVGPLRDTVCELGDVYDEERFRDGDVLIGDGGSKYTRPTGPGYLGVHRVGQHSLDIVLGQAPGDWTADQRAPAVETRHGVALLPPEQDGQSDESVIGTVKICAKWQATYATVPDAVLEALGVAEGDDVRVYERPRGSGLLLVRAADDPMLGAAAGGGD